MDDKIILSTYQGGMHLTVQTSKVVCSKMVEIREQNPELWERKDLYLLIEAKRQLGLIKDE